MDLSETELQRTLADIPEGTFKNVKCYGLHGTYDDGLAWLKEPKNKNKPKTILSLGSSIGNFPRDEAAAFLSQFGDALGSNDCFLLGLDACTNGDKVYHAYNDREGLTHEFVLNGLKHANKLLGHDEFHIPDWIVIGEYDQQAGRHHAFVVPNKDVTILGTTIKADEKVRIEESYKYDSAQSDALWRRAKLSEGARWTNASGDYGEPSNLFAAVKGIAEHDADSILALHFLNRPKISYPLKAEEYASSPVPSIEDWELLWAAWDAVTLDMIPEEELLEKPIKLRNACIFYLGHIPTFLDMHLTRSTQGKPTEPSHYPQIFERGIDPDVDNPEQCHSHSEIPDSWPPATEILDFQSRVRIRTRNLYSSGQANSDLKVRRAMWLGFEHEVMHLETLLYMLVQSEKTLPPPGTIRPDFEMMATQAKRNAVPNQWIEIPEQEVTIGIDDLDDNSGPEHHFGWDVEKPARKVRVGSFMAQARPITNGDYAKYLQETGTDSAPASWLLKSSSNGHTNGYANGLSSIVHGKSVRTVYGPVPLEYALDWPVSASYDELAGCASWMGGRIPTFEEARSVYSYADGLKRKEAVKSGSTIPAVNGHLVNDGVEESPPSKPYLDGSKAAAGLGPQELFVDLEEANVGFTRWHPMPVTQNGDKLSGQGDMGGLWEWTSSALEPHQGYEPMELYPAYSCGSHSAETVICSATNMIQRTSLTRNTTLSWEAHGPLILESPDVRACECFRVHIQPPFTNRLVSIGTSAITHTFGLVLDWSRISRL